MPLEEHLIRIYKSFFLSSRPHPLRTSHTLALSAAAAVLLSISRGILTGENVQYRSSNSPQMLVLGGVQCKSMMLVETVLVL